MDQNELVEILWVEDDPLDAELGLRALRKHNLANRVCWVKDGAEALDYLFGEGVYAGRNRLDAPKVIFLDLKLPKIDGIEVLRAVKSNALTKNIPVVVLTSSHEECDVVGSYALGVNSYVVKPMDFDKFIDAVAELGLYWVLLNKPPL